MSEFYERLQTLVLTMADTMDIWRDVAIMLLAGIVIGCLWYYAEAS
jgi:cytochrome c biogenesis factor